MHLQRRGLQFGLAQVVLSVVVVVASCVLMSLLRNSRVRHEYPPCRTPRSPVPRRRSSYDDDLEALSPHGTRSHSLGLPEDFQPSKECHDSRVLGGRKLFKTVQATQWSREWGLAGKRIEDISLPELTWLGWENWGLRSLSAGCYTSVVFARSVREGQCVDIFQRELRSRHIDIESAAIHWAQHENQSSASAGGMSREDKNEIMNKFVKWIVDQVQKWSVSAVEESQNVRIRQLEAQLAELKSQNGQGPWSAGELPKRKYADEASMPPAKKTRTTGKQKPEEPHDDHLSFDDLFNLDPPKKPLRADCPPKAGTSSVTAWLKKLPATVQSQALADYKVIEPLVKTWSDDQIGSLKEVASAWGLPVQLSVSMSNKDLVRVIIAAHHLPK